MERTITTQIKNLGIIENFEGNLENCKILLLQGGNMSGKTTIRQEINALFKARATKVGTVTKGKDEGWTKMELPDKDGNTVLVRHNFNKYDQNAQFTITNHLGKTFSSREKIMSILGNTNSLSVDDMFNLTRTPEGTRKFIKDFIYVLIPNEIKEKLVKLESEIKANIGTVVIERKVAKQIWDSAKIIANEITELTEEELKRISLLPSVQKQLDDLNKSLEDNEVDIKSNTEIETQITVLKANHNITKITEENKLTTVKNTEKQTEGLIAELTNKLREAERQLERDKSAVIVHQNEILNNTELRTKELNLLTKKPVSVSIDVDKAKEDIEKGNTFVSGINNLLVKQTSLRTNNESVIKAKDKWEELERTINLKRTEKDNLIKDSIPFKGVSYDSELGKIIFNGFELSDEYTSESEAKVLFANMKCVTETSSLIDLGNASVFDNKSMKKLEALAEKYNKIILMEEVTKSNDEIRFVNLIIE